MSENQPPINRLLATQVTLNLEHQQLWSNVNDVVIYIDEKPFVVCTGRPSTKIHPDDPDPNQNQDQDQDQEGPRPQHVTEYVIPVPTESTWSLKKMKTVFDQLEKLTGSDISRVIMAMVTNDSTIMYYISAKGLVKPRKN